MIDRYQNLFRTLDELGAAPELGGHLSFLEIGTYDGVRAAQLLNHWLRNGDRRTASYVGFDLFENLTPEMSRAELSKSRLPPSRREVLKRMGAALPKADRWRLRLLPGNTRETLPAFVAALGAGDRPSLVFMDGGHSPETVASDWACVRRLLGPRAVALLDDYYENREDFGCKPLVDGLAADPSLAVRVLDPADHVESTGLVIRMARVSLA
jgi:hypothetical protein